MASVSPRRAAPAVLGRISNVLAPLAFLVLVIIALSVIARDNGFMTQENWKNIFQSIAVVAILAVAETAVIITGGIDLSVGRVLAVSGVVAASAMVDHHVSIPVAVLLACATGALAGMVNGLLTSYGRMPSFIATLGMLGVANGVALVVARDQNISNVPPAFDWFSRGELFGSAATQGIPIPLVLMLLAFVVVHILLTRTGWGRRLYAVGGNRDAARLSGVSLNKTTVSVFVLAGLLAGFASVIHVSRTGSGQPTAGVNMELQAIAATVIGGTSLSGGQGGVVGTLIGAFLMAVIQNGCDLKGVEYHSQIIIIGVVIWLAALYDGLRRRRSA